MTLNQIQWDQVRPKNIKYIFLKIRFFRVFEGYCTKVGDLYTPFTTV